MDTTFVIQKALWFLALPPASVIVLILVGLVAVNRRRLLGKTLIFLGVALLYLLSLGQVADLIIKPLEKPYPPLKEDRISADAVVVLGGGSVDLEWLGAGPVPNAETLSRLVTGVTLAKKLRIPLVLSMGNGEPFTTKVNDADTMAKAAYEMGVPRNQMIVENTSRDTLENAREVRKLIKGNRIILSTSAYHMIRARAMFAKRGFSVIPAPSYYLAQTRKLTPVSFIPRAADLHRSATGIAEWMSLVWWGVRGEI
jgi:uncharacterized SAM-binding protein YcdF (DUF218 family)